ncbi:MAG: site-specific DNA-methyltransferase [Candidatus Lokiarchaeota archaeon]
MVSLKWKDKEQELKQLDKKTTDLSTLIYKQEILIPSIIKSKEKVLTSNQKSINSYESQIKRDQINNLLIYGENKQILSTMLDQYKEKINLIYIDPPFATGGDFNLKLFYSKEKNNYIESLAYDDTWNAGIDSYLSFLYKRLYLMRDLLSPKGSIYLHLDYHVVHYVKIMMDEIFGSENFRNEIIWSYPAASARTKNFYVRSYDSILFYTKTNDYIFNDDENIYMEYSDRVRNSLKEDSNGLFYYRGGSHDGKKLSRKVYVEKNGVFPRDVWKDIPYIRANTKEYQGFSTQKPERLLKRIILASSNKGDLVADFFCGSGTTLVVAEKLDRHWIGCDANWYSINRTSSKKIFFKRFSTRINL